MDDRSASPKKPISQSQASQPQQPKPSPSAQTTFKSKSRLLLEIIAISGEIPAESIHHLIDAPSYASKIVSELISDKLLILVNKSGVKGYRLGVMGKRKLLKENPDRFKDMFEGDTETNRFRAEIDRRLRVHSTAEVYMLMYNAGIRIFKDMKPKIYLHDVPVSPSQTTKKNSVRDAALNVGDSSTTVRPSPQHFLPTTGNSGQPSGHNDFHRPTITTPCFYSSREQKSKKDNKIRKSRAAGTLLTPTHIYAIYNTGGTVSRWDDVENTYKAEVTSYICHKLLNEQYSGIELHGIMIGKDMGILEKYLAKLAETQSSKEVVSSVLNDFLTRTYKPFYFITNNYYGEVQLRILCDSIRMKSLKNALLKGLLPYDAKYPIEHDALTKDGNPVLFCCLLDIPRLVRFENGIRAQRRAGKIIAFDFQQEMLERYLGEEVEVKSINFEKLIVGLFPKK